MSVYKWKSDYIVDWRVRIIPQKFEEMNSTTDLIIYLIISNWHLLFEILHKFYANLCAFVPTKHIRDKFRLHLHLDL